MLTIGLIACGAQLKKKVNGWILSVKNESVDLPKLSAQVTPKL